MKPRELGNVGGELVARNANPEHGVTREQRSGRGSVARERDDRLAGGRKLRGVRNLGEIVLDDLSLTDDLPHHAAPA